MNNYPSDVKEKLNSIIQDMSDHHWLFTNNPKSDFSRQHLGKLSFYNTLRLIISMGKNNTNEEIMDFFDLDPDAIPSQSAFSQRRSLLAPNTFPYLFEEFSASFPQTTHTFKDKCVLAFDGCHIVYTTNAEIIADYNKPRLADYKGYNHMHLNGFVDVVSKAFLDVEIQPGQHPDERLAMRTMLDHFNPEDPSKYIITVDRGYESYDNIFQCELKGLYYVFRAKAPSSSKSLLSSYIEELPDNQEEFDVAVQRFFTDKYTKIIKAQSDVYHYMNPYKTIPHFQELLNGKSLHYLKFRALKIKTGDNQYEYLITNLPYAFDIDDLKDCYHLRWGIETTFRYLKHANGMLYFHSKKPEFLMQEIYANLILYNFGIFLANEAASLNRRKNRRSGNKHEYHVDISSALKIARKYLQSKTTDLDGKILDLMCKYVHAVKTEPRYFKRPLRGIGAIHFGYR